MRNKGTCFLVSRWNTISKVLGFEMLWVLSFLTEKIKEISLERSSILMLFLICFTNHMTSV